MAGPSPGWADRMDRSRAAIVGAALELFERRGFEAVTVAEIARAAGVSERTVFRYFPTKDRIVLEDRPDEFAAFLAALHDAPAGEPLVTSIDRTVRAFSPPPADVGTELRRIRLILGTPTLRTAWIEDLRALEPRLAAWIADRTGRPADQLEVRVAAAALVATQRLLVEAWLAEDPATDFATLTRRALAVLDEGFATALEQPAVSHRRPRGSGGRQPARGAR